MIANVSVEDGCYLTMRNEFLFNRYTFTTYVSGSNMD